MAYLNKEDFQYLMKQQKKKEFDDKLDLIKDSAIC